MSEEGWMSERTNNGGNTQVSCCGSQHRAWACLWSGQWRCWAASALLLQGGPRNPHLDQEFWSLSRGACGVLLSQLWGSAKAAGSLCTAVPRPYALGMLSLGHQRASLPCGKCADRMISSGHFSITRTEALTSEKEHAHTQLHVCMLCVV